MQTEQKFQEAEQLVLVELAGDLFVVRQYKESASVASVHIWHRRLGHRNYDAVMKLKYLAQGVDIKGRSCKAIVGACIQGKMHRKSFPKISATMSSDVMKMVHTDICGPMRTTTAGGRRYFLTLEKLEEYVEMAKQQFCKKP